MGRPIFSKYVSFRECTEVRISLEPTPPKMEGPHSQVPRCNILTNVATEDLSRFCLHRMDVKGQYVVVVVLFSPSIPN